MLGSLPFGRDGKMWIMSKLTTILGIDPGYGRCGFGVLVHDGRDWQCKTHGVITTSKDVALPSRLKEIADDLTHLIELHKPERIVIEELFFAKNTTTALNVSQVRGIVSLLAAQNGIELVEVKPNEVKLAITGYGRADKKQVQEMVKTILGLKTSPKPDDAADALAVAWTGANKLQIDSR